MSDTITRPQLLDPFGGGMQFPEEQSNHAVSSATGMAPMGHTAVDEAQAGIVLAQRVPVKRNVPAILQEVKTLATARGKEFFYSIPFKEKLPDGGERVTRVEGLTVQAAMAVMMAYGNCRVRCLPARETATHWTFLAEFNDHEKGGSVLRSFNQRKQQNTGMKDRGRQEDIIFQIGQSKAIRNVILAGLGWLCEEAFIAAKSGVVQRIADNPEQARAYIIRKIEEMEVSLARVERTVGRAAAHWLAQDMAKIFSELGSINDGFADPDELWPRPEPSGGPAMTNAAVAQGMQNDTARQQQQAKAASEPKPRQTRKPAEDKPKPTEAPRETPREDTLDADAAFLGGQDARTDDNPELDAYATNPESRGQDPGPTMGTDPSDEELRFE